MAETASIAFDDVLLQIGKLNYAWTNTESLLVHLIAGLAGTGKDAALLIFLTLNTTRARIDLVERLAKMDGRDPAERDDILGVTRELGQLAALRNRYNHCIYAFDPQGGTPRTILMRVADRKDAIKLGQSNDLDRAALADIERSIEGLSQLNRRVWALIGKHAYPA
jgi:hypothetical protein